jgi:hypothetical protein
MTACRLSIIPTPQLQLAVCWWHPTGLQCRCCGLRAYHQPAANHAALCAWQRANTRRRSRCGSNGTRILSHGLHLLIVTKRFGFKLCNAPSITGCLALLWCAGQRKQQQQQQQQGDADDPTLRRPLPPPEHDWQEGCYYWSGSRTSPYSGAAAPADGGGLGKPEHRCGSDNSSIGGPGVTSQGGPGGTGSMETSATTRFLHSQGQSEIFSTARSPSQTWGSALSRLKQLQMQTVEALGVQ